MVQKYFNGTAVRAVIRSGDPWFIARDVCLALGLDNVGQAILSLDEDEKSKISNSDLGTPGGHPSPIINESGLYTLIIRSRKAEAKEFKRWVTHDVLPSIRKTGKYEIQTEDDIQQKIVKTLSYSKHPVTQEQWEVNRDGRDIRFDLVHRNSRHVHVFELKNRALSGDDVIEKLYDKDYHGAVLNLAGKRKASFYFVANNVSPGAIKMLKALSKDGVSYAAMSTEDFYRWARRLVGRDYPGFDWYYNNILDGQLRLEAV